MIVAARTRATSPPMIPTIRCSIGSFSVVFAGVTVVGGQLERKGHPVLLNAAWNSASLLRVHRPRCSRASKLTSTQWVGLPHCQHGAGRHAQMWSRARVARSISIATARLTILTINLSAAHPGRTRTPTRGHLPGDSYVDTAHKPSRCHLDAARSPSIPLAHHAKSRP